MMVVMDGWILKIHLIAMLIYTLSGPVICSSPHYVFR